MKKYIIPAALIVLVACGNPPASDTKTSETPAAATPEKTDTEKDKGMELIAQSDCLTCHKLNEQLIGPSYKAVAEKYENTDENVKMLAGKIIKGGQGVWGSVPMTAHPAISEADAILMVKYIMAQK
jgi:cytochrome c